MCSGPMRVNVIQGAWIRTTSMSDGSGSGLIDNKIDGGWIFDRYTLYQYLSE